MKMPRHNFILMNRKYEWQAKEDRVLHEKWEMKNFAIGARKKERDSHEKMNGNITMLTS